MTLSEAGMRIQRDVDGKYFITLEKGGFLLQWNERVPSAIRYQSSRIPPLAMHGGGFLYSDLLRFVQQVEKHNPYWAHEYKVIIEGR